jgi:anti-sigma factor RsiW
MCPDSDLLSAYFDDEVPSPWKEKLERHVESCAECGSRLSSFRALKAAMEASPEPDHLPAKERVYASVMRQVASSRVAAVSSPSFGGNRVIWRRSVSIPLPIAAAAVLVFVALAVGFSVVRLQQPGLSPTLASSARTDTAPVTVQFTDMKSVMQYLESQDDRKDVMIVVPGAYRFKFQGNPQLLKASDFTRSFSH